MLKQVKRSKEDRGQRHEPGDDGRRWRSAPTARCTSSAPAASSSSSGVAEHGVTPIRTYSEDEAIDLGLIDEDAELDAAGAYGLAIAASRAGAVRWLDRLKDRTVRR